MKKRILAVILAVAMVTSVFVGVAVNAEGEFDNAKVVLTKSFDEQDATVDSGSIVADPNGGAGKAWMLTDAGDVQTAKIAELDSSKTYTMVLRVSGGIASFGLQQMDAVNVYYGQYKYDGTNNWICGIQYYYDMGAVEYQRSPVSTWDYYAIKFTGVPSFKFCVKNQDVDGLTDGHIYVDDLLILEGDYVDACRAWINDGTKTNPYSLVYDDLPTLEVEDGTLSFAEDFEDGNTTIKTTVGGSAGITVDPTDPTNKVYNISDTTWGHFLTNALVEDLDPTKEYTMKVDVIGDINWMGLTATEHWATSYYIAGCNGGYQDKYVIQATFPELQTWKTAIFKFTGLSVVKLTGQVQSTQGYMNGNLYIDNLVVYEGDMVDELTPTSEPVVEPTVAPFAYVESPHDYPNYYDNTWTIREDNATGIAITFSSNTFVESICDYIDIYDSNNYLIGTYTGRELAGERLCVNGDTIRIRLRSDGSVTEYGFAVVDKQVFYNWYTPYWWEPLNQFYEATAAITPAPTTAYSPRPSSRPSSRPSATQSPSPSPTPSPSAVSDYRYYLNSDGTIEITKYMGVDAVVVVPVTIDGHAVTSIGDRAFAGNGILEKVILPDSVIEIGNNAFDSCVKLNTVIFGNFVEKIGASAFINCPLLKSVSIPVSVKEIGAYAFGYNSSLNKIDGFKMDTYSSVIEEYAKKYDIAYVNPNGKPMVKKTSIKFTKKSVKIKKGKKVTLKVKITGAKKAKFSVDKKGKKVVKLMKKKANSVVVKGMKKGKATITAKAAGKKAKCKVTVK